MKWLKEAMAFIEFYKNIIRRIKEANVEQIRKEVMEGGEL